MAGEVASPGAGVSGQAGAGGVNPAGSGPGGTGIIPETVYYLHDRLGSVIGLVAEDGALVERYAYDAYGRTHIERLVSGSLTFWPAADPNNAPFTTSGFDNPWLWTGQRYDAAPQLYHFLYRTYSPRLGRWLQHDPAGYVDGVNLYEYVSGMPFGGVDPLGLSWFDDAWNFTVGAGKAVGNAAVATANAVGDAAVYVGQRTADMAVAGYNTAVDVGRDVADALSPESVMHTTQGVLMVLDRQCPMARQGIETGACTDQDCHEITHDYFYQGRQNTAQALINTAKGAANSVIWANNLSMRAVGGTQQLGYLGYVDFSGYYVSDNTNGWSVGMGHVGGEALLWATLAKIFEVPKCPPRRPLSVPDSPPAPVRGVAGDLEGAAGRAAETIGPGKGPVYGTRVHSAFEGEVNALGNGNLSTEVSYLNGQVVPRGTPGSVRLDVVEGPVTGPTSIYDLKTGSATLTPGRIQQIQSHIPGGANVPVVEVRP